MLHVDISIKFRLSIPFREGPQQGDPLCSLQFANPRHLSSVNSTELEIGFINDLSTSVDFHTLVNDEETIIKAITSIGVKLNIARCEIIITDFCTLDSFHIFRGFIQVPKGQHASPRTAHCTGAALDGTLQEKVDNQ